MEALQRNLRVFLESGYYSLYDYTNRAKRNDDREQEELLSQRELPLG